MKIGFIGQGFIGKNMADDFEERGYEVIRYSLDDEYVHNDKKIADCDVTFIAVPTPTTKAGFDSSIVESVLPLIGKGKVAVIKSTILPGTTKKLQEKFKDIIILHSPEFLTVKNAHIEVRKPSRNIIGVVDDEHKEIANQVTSILPKSEYNLICKAEEAEIIKYTGNIFLAMKVVYMNCIYDLAKEIGADYSKIAEAVGSDSRIGHSHTRVIDGENETTCGRGAGGYCFPKDLAALREFYVKTLPDDSKGIVFIESLEKKNIDLMLKTQKDLHLLQDMYEDLSLE